MADYAAISKGTKKDARDVRTATQYRATEGSIPMVKQKAEEP